MTDELLDKPPVNKTPILVGVAILLVALGIGVYWYSAKSGGPAAPEVVQAPPAAVPEQRIEHPVPPSTDASSGPLPDLNDSDKPFNEALAALPGGAAAVPYLVPESLIRHLVVTVDNLPRPKVAVDKRPVTPAPGAFMARGDELHSTLDERNFQRYAPMIDALRKLDVQRVAAVYLHYYPLFQKAYQDLGYPNGYFNDRLVQVIDSLLATPQISGPIDLVRPNVMYVFADQSLESRPAGQKILLRIGPANAAVVKAKLTELRAAITAAPPKH